MAPKTKKLPKVDPKPWYQSKTLLVNLASALLASVMLAQEWLTAGHLPIESEYRPGLLFALAVTNIWLRMVTSRPIERP